MDTKQRKKELLKLRGGRGLIYLIGMENAYRWPLACIRECGPATQTFAGLRDVTSDETFTAISNICKRSFVPKKTAEKHLHKLAKAGWVVKGGRTKTPSGRLRRTVTHKISEYAKSNQSPYILFYPELTPASMNFSGCVLYSFLITRLARRYMAALRESNAVDDHEWFAALPEEEPELFRLSLSWLQEHLGLSRATLVKAKYSLEYVHELIEVTTEDQRDYLKPIIREE